MRRRRPSTSGGAGALTLITATYLCFFILSYHRSSSVLPACGLPPLVRLYTFHNFTLLLLVSNYPLRKWQQSRFPATKATGPGPGTSLLSRTQGAAERNLKDTGCQGKRSTCNRVQSYLGILIRILSSNFLYRKKSYGYLLTALWVLLLQKPIPTPGWSQRPDAFCSACSSLAK